MNTIPIQTDTVTAEQKDKDRVRAQASDAAEKFEAHFIKKMMEQMRASNRAMSEADGKSHAHFNDDMLDVADGLVADALAHQRAFGIADLMLKHVLPTDLSPKPAGSPSPGKTTAQDSKP
ncbi:MAG: flagellar biosynthesis protein FlgJ [Paucibacter sp.]|nr:flagellar biosynthesis protein FlgJ [Roseateles sp.]